jgi:DegV family protein with EDD domain
LSQVRIVTDSTAELEAEQAQALSITVVPWRVQAGGDRLIDGPALRTADFYQDLIARRRALSALPPSPRQFADAYGRVARGADEILSIHGTPMLGNALTAARRGHLELLGRCSVTVIDSQFTSRALGLLVLEAARAAQAGAQAEEIKRLVHGLIPRTYLALHLESFDQVAREGLLRESRESMGVTATYRPLLLLEAGRLASLQRSRRRGEPVERMIEFVGEFAVLKGLWILHAAIVPELSALREHLALATPGLAFEDHVYGPVLASLIGPTALGLVAFEG